METSRVCRAAIHEPSQEETPCPDLPGTAAPALRVRFQRSFSLRLVVDFKAVKAAVCLRPSPLRSGSMLQVLEHYGLAESFKRSGNSLSGPCPLHNGQNRTQFRVSLEKNYWNCFGTCKGGGNVLDFVARKEGCSLREAALALCDWFQLPTQEKPARHGTWNESAGS